MTPFDRGNMISLQPGFLLVGIRGDNQIEYCQLEESYKPFLGYHNKSYQIINIEDQILHLHDFPLQFSALCQGSCYTGVTNNAQQITVPETGQLIFVLSGVDKIANTGLSNWGSVERIDDDWIKFVTNTGEIRAFNGRDFGPDETTDPEKGKDKMVRAMQDAYKQFTAIYSRFTGYILWWRRK